MEPVLNLGAWRHLDGKEGGHVLGLPADHLVTHGVVVGMTGSGKTGLITVLIEEAARAGVPTLVIDVKGDLPNLLLAFPDFTPAPFEPWIARPRDGLTPEAVVARATELAENRRVALSEWGIGEPELAAYARGTDIRVLTPGGSAGEPLHILSSLERRSPHWDTDPEAARDALAAAISLVLRLLGREPDPAKSREHVLLSVLAERRLAAGQPPELGALLQDILEPPMDRIGALSVNAFTKKTERRALAAAPGSAPSPAPSSSAPSSSSTKSTASFRRTRQTRRPSGPSLPS